MIKKIIFRTYNRNILFLLPQGNFPTEFRYSDLAVENVLQSIIISWKYVKKFLVRKYLLKILNYLFVMNLKEIMNLKI